MNVTFSINGVNFSQKLSTYNVTKERAAQKIITTLAFQELAFGSHDRTIITVSFWPLTEKENAVLYSAMSGDVEITYTDMYFGNTNTEVFRCLESVENDFALMSVDGKRRYKGGSIVFRAVSASA